MDNLTEEVASTSVPVPPASEELFDQQLNSPLFSLLPGELRNEIIRFAVVEPSEIKPEITHSINVLTGKSTATLVIEHPLMLTCKRLRQESAEIYFLENTFRLTDEFFSEPPTVTLPTIESSHQPQHKANERAIQTLAHAFGPWASKLRRLGLSHAICYDATLGGGMQQRRRRAEVDLYICRAAQEEPGIHLECVGAHDPHTPSVKLCFCGIAQHAAEHCTDGIFEFAQGLVRMMDLKTGEHSLPHCWSCGLRPMF